MGKGSRQARSSVRSHTLLDEADAADAGDPMVAEPAASRMTASEKPAARRVDMGEE